MKLNRLAAYLFACMAFASSFFIYLEYIHALGFPDGFITELGYAERKLAYIFIAISMIVGAGFVYLGGVAGRKVIGRRLFTGTILYLIFIIGIVLLDNYYQTHLAGSAGG